MKASCLFAIFCLSCSLEPAVAQEHVTGLIRNRIVEDAANKTQRFRLKNYSSADTISLPFFDDFASVTIFPDQRLWTDSFAYINSQFGINPPTIGVATLDALDENGAVYLNASSTSFPADKLTSRNINLNFPVDSNIYFSFFYQAKGLGHSLKTSDSLVVQFFAPLQNKWKTVWSIPGDTLAPFKQVLFPVNDSSFLHNAFRFRFMNYASLGFSDGYAGKLGDNSDWNIDYVYLNKGRNSNDTLLNDLAVTAPLPSLLSYYESIPWDHFVYAADELMATGKTLVNYHFYSVNPSDSIGTDRTFKISSSYTNYRYTFGPNANNIHAEASLLYEPYYEKLSYDGNDSALFNVLFYLSNYGLNSSSNYRWNDTVRRMQVFKDYYAYDDGSAENGYGLSGLNADNARFAYKFFSYKPDSLRAIDMYFNDVFDDANAKLFDLTVWDSNNGTPSNILFSKSDASFVPVFLNRNHFIRFMLDPPVAVQDTFYVGWVQTADEFLNVGLDVNRVSTSKMFYNINGNWQMSQIQGSIMIRPVFGKRIITRITDNAVSQNFNIYPNPASDLLFVSSGNNDYFPLKVNFYDLSGKLVFSSRTAGEAINISFLADGFYIVRINNGKTVEEFHKLRVIR
jgi:hypothetical protein